jgi:hypothetical protein
MIRRRIFSFASVLSLLLCLATVGLWVHSYRVLDPMSDYPTTGDEMHSTTTNFQSRKGQIDFEWWWHFEGLNRTVDWYWHGLGLTCTKSYIQFDLMHWMMAAMYSVLPTLWLGNHLRHKVIASNEFKSCAYCRYNLTGNTSGVCPECGTAVKAVA